MPALQARSSVVEHHLDMVGVVGSKPIAPTISKVQIRLLGTLSAKEPFSFPLSALWPLAAFSAAILSKTLEIWGFTGTEWSCVALFAAVQSRGFATRRIASTGLAAGERD